MKLFIRCICFIFFFKISHAQVYFPPISGTAWDTISPTSLYYCQDRIDSLYSYLQANNTKSFVLLYEGKIVLEKYFNGQTQNDLWYWASAGKSLTSFLVGLAQQDGFLSIQDSTSKYLGQGWTNCTSQQESKITIKHQLSMTTGLDDGVADDFCTIDSCLIYKADAGTRWAYHNGPYTLLDSVLEVATGLSLNQLNTQKMKNKIGMNGSFVKSGFNNVYFSTARSMARFGLLVYNKGIWNGNPIMTDSNYFNAMVSTSQGINNSYGYLWWLNGKSNFMIPGSQIIFNSSLMSAAPSDAIMALGKNGQFINSSQIKKMVWVRMGEEPSGNLVPFVLNDSIWAKIMTLECPTQITSIAQKFNIENPIVKSIDISQNYNTMLVNSNGQTIYKGNKIYTMNFENLPTGVYVLKINDGKTVYTMKLWK